MYRYSPVIWNLGDVARLSLAASHSSFCLCQNTSEFIVGLIMMIVSVPNPVDWGDPKSMIKHWKRWWWVWYDIDNVHKKGCSQYVHHMFIIFLIIMAFEVSVTGSLCFIPWLWSFCWQWPIGPAVNNVRARQACRAHVPRTAASNGGFAIFNPEVWRSITKLSEHWK